MCSKKNWVILKDTRQEFRGRALSELGGSVLEQAAGVRLKCSKYFFMLRSVEYLGSHLREEPTNKKVQLAPAPSNQAQLKSFLRPN